MRSAQQRFKAGVNPNFSCLQSASHFANYDQWRKIHVIHGSRFQCNLFRNLESSWTIHPTSCDSSAVHSFSRPIATCDDVGAALQQRFLIPVNSRKCPKKAVQELLRGLSKPSAATTLKRPTVQWWLAVMQWWCIMVIKVKLCEYWEITVMVRVMVCNNGTERHSQFNHSWSSCGLDGEEWQKPTLPNAFILGNVTWLCLITSNVKASQQVFPCSLAGGARAFKSSLYTRNAGLHGQMH